MDLQTNGLRSERTLNVRTQFGVSDDSVGVWNEKDDMQTRLPELWIGLVEFRPFDREAYGDAGAFSHIVTWAHDAAEFRKKADTIATTMDLYVLAIEGEEPLAKWPETQSPSEEIEDMIQRAESNPNAIVYGTFHRYRVDQG